MEELKPCPFCGGKARLRTVMDSNFVECGNCYAHGSSQPTKQLSISAWNRRVAPESDNAQLYLKAYQDLLQKAENLNEMLLKKLKTSSQKELLSCAGCKNFEVDNISDTCAECARFVHPDYYTRKPEGSKKE